MNFGDILLVPSGMMCTHVVRNEKSYLIEETLSKSGVYAKEDHVVIGEKIEIKPTLRNEEKVSVFDISIASSIGSIAAGVHEVNILLNEIKKDAAQRHIHDAKVEQVIEDVKQITDKSDGKTVEMQDKLDAIENKIKHAINENISEIPENLSEKEVEDLSKKNIEILESIVYESAKEKAAVIEARIVELEREKASVNAALRCVEASQELGNAFYDSAIDGLKSVLEALNYTIENPGEVLQSACEISLHLGKKAVNFAQYCVENPNLIYDKVILKSKELYEYTRDNLGECALNVAEYIPGICGILEGSRDFYQIYEAKTEPRTVADKWRNYGILAAVLGKGGRKTAESIVEILQEAEVKAGAKQFNLTRYGGPGGGHHIHMKSAYKSHPLYNLNEALCLSNEEMAKFGIKHNLANIMQRKMCADLVRSGKSMTRVEMNKISVEALVAGGADRELARSIVAKSQLDLKNKGVRHPTDIPWRKREEK